LVSGDQQDAHEFYSYFLDKVCCEFLWILYYNNSHKYYRIKNELEERCYVSEEMKGVAVMTVML